jgi:ferritin-like metal-binding protein YciE
MAMDTLEKLFVHELQDLYSAEQQIIKALPKMIKAATARELASALEGHLAQTEKHRTRLEKVFANLDRKPQAKKCKGMAGLIEEGEDALAEEMTPEIRDAALICAAQRVEHYEMAAYGCLRTFAKLLGDMPSAKLLQETLDEEADSDRKLTQIAEFSINLRLCEPVTA